MQALLGVERHLLGIEQLPMQQRAAYDLAPHNGDGKINQLDLALIERSLLGGIELGAFLSPPPMREDSVRVAYGYAWHEQSQGRIVATHTQSVPGSPGALQRQDFDAQGNLVRNVNAAGEETRWGAYSALGLPGWMVNAAGTETQFEYHPRGWLLSTAVKAPADPSGVAVTRYSYDRTGRLVRITLPTGRWRSYEYDPRGQLLSLRDSGGQQANFSLDGAGNRVLESLCSHVDEDAQTEGCAVHFEFERLFDGMGRLRRTVRGGAVRREFGYDANSRPRVLHDGNRNAQALIYDAHGRLTRLHFPAAQPREDTDAVVQMAYREDGALLSIEDERALTTRYQRDAFGDITGEADPGRGNSFFGWSPTGMLASQSDAAGRLQYLYRDAAGRLIRVYSPSSPDSTIRFLYGSPGEDGYSAGKLLYAGDRDTGNYFDHDHRGNIVRKTTRIGSKHYHYAFQYDLDDNLAAVVLPDGRAIRYSRDSSGRVSAVDFEGADSEGHDFESINIASAVQYLPFGPVKSLGLGNGVSRRSDFGRDYRVARISDSAGEFNAVQAFEYDGDGNVTRITRSGIDQSTQAFSYDAANRLVSMQDGLTRMAFQYDAAGNRTAKQVFDPVGNLFAHAVYNYDAQTGRLVSIAGVSRGAESSEYLAYDATGRETDREAPGRAPRRLQYDAFGRLAAAGVGEAQWQYRYDAFGRRSSKSSATEAWHMVYDTAGRMLARYHALDDLAIHYVYLGDERIARIIDASGQTHVEYYHNDHLGRPYAITNGNAQLVWLARYAAFGARNVVVENTIAQVHGLPGQVLDAESGLWYNYHRYYDSTTGRYLQGDALGREGGLNTYLYAGANPLRFTDPLGLFFFGPVCGSGASARFVPDSIFTEACASHDACYGDCSKSKEQCDLALCTDGACLYGFLLSTVFSGASGNAYDNAQKDCDDCE